MFTVTYKKSENSMPNSMIVRANCAEKASWIVSKLGYIVILVK